MVVCVCVWFCAERAFVSKSQESGLESSVQSGCCQNGAGLEHNFKKTRDTGKLNFLNVWRLRPWRCPSLHTPSLTLIFYIQLTGLFQKHLWPLHSSHIIFWPFLWSVFINSRVSVCARLHFTGCLCSPWSETDVGLLASVRRAWSLNLPFSPLPSLTLSIANTLHHGPASTFPSRATVTHRCQRKETKWRQSKEQGRSGESEEEGATHVGRKTVDGGDNNCTER